MTMTAVSLAIVSNRNEPVYIKEFFHEAPSAGDDLPFEEELFGLPAPFENTEESSALPKRTECSLRQQFILHAALDRFEQLDGPPPGYAWRKQGVASGADAMFLGLLCPVEDMRVYGYMTTTRVKFLLAVQEDAAWQGEQRTMDETIKRLFVKIHRAYIEYTLNPFCELEAEIKSTRFDAKVQASAKAYNHAIH